MVRGTTPSHIFNLPFQTTNITDAYITYKQDGTLVLEKEKGGSGVTMSGSEITVALTQSETLSFTSGINVEIQVAVAINSKVFRSQIITINSERILKDEAI